MKRLLVESYKSELQSKTTETFMDDYIISDDIEMEWKKFKEEIYQCAAAVLGYSKQKHQDWFNENDIIIQSLLDSLHRTYLTWINDKNSQSKRDLYIRARQDVQTKLRKMKEDWWCKKAKKIANSC